MAHKHFFNKLLNSDDAAGLVNDSELINMSNLRFGTSDQSEIAGLQNIRATVQRYTPVRPPAGAWNLTPHPIVCIGATSDENNGFVVWFTHQEGNVGTEFIVGDLPWDAIWLYDRKSGTTYCVWDGIRLGMNLGFTDSNLIHSARIVNDTLYWTDNLNPPRSLHLGAAIRMMSGIISSDDTLTPIPSVWKMQTPLKEDDISLIKITYPLAPTAVKVHETDTAKAKVNRIFDESFRFAVEYEYYNGEKSVIGAWSKASLVNSKAQNEGASPLNAIDVALDMAAKIPQGVRRVNVVVLFDSTFRAFICKTFDRSVAADATLISNHNAGTTALATRFYNNAIGEGIDDAALIQPFHSVPELVGTLEVSRNRLFLANNTEGKDTPGTTSLQVQAIEMSSVGNIVNPHHIVYDSFDGTQWYDVSVAAIYLSDAPTVGWYIIDGSQSYGTEDFGGEATIDDSVTAALINTSPTYGTSDLIYCGLDITTIPSHYEPPGAVYQSGTVYDKHVWTDIFVTVAGLPGATAGSTQTQFKGGGEYQFGVVFLDSARRKSGVVTKEALRLQIADLTYGFTTRTPLVNWTLSNEFAAAEIPDYATHYAIVRTLNLRTRKFMHDYDNTVQYYKRNTDGTLTGAIYTYDETVSLIGISLNGLQQAGLGYAKVEEGDTCYLTASDSDTVSYTIPVDSIDGERVYLKGTDIGALDSTGLTRAFSFEIYSPYKPVSNEPYYEIGEVFAISNPGQSTRSYGSLGGSITGDVSVVTRKLGAGSNYNVEAMNPNDKYWKRWDTDAGRINLVTNKGRYANYTGIRFSNTFIPGTDTNGLSAFEIFNQDSLPIEMGRVQKLQLTSKAQSEGTVMLAIGVSETSSIYIGEGQLADVSGNGTLIRTINVIGQVNLLKGSLGTLHPESVALHGGRVFWLDASNGAVAAYADNGLFEQSAYKLRRATMLLCAKLRTLSAHVPGGFDPFHGEYLFSVPQTETTPPKGLLAPYTDRYSPYDFYDGRAKTWVAKVDADRFQGSQDFLAECFVSLGEKLYSFNGGSLWEHNASSNYNSFYGVSVQPSLAFVENGEPDSSVKTFDALTLEANQTPEFTHIRTETDGTTFYEQSSDLSAANWGVREGIRYVSLFRDLLSPNTSGTLDEKAVKGDRMRGQFAKIYLEFSNSAGLLQIRIVGVTYRASKGHINL